jgi:hypothetical protein
MKKPIRYTLAGLGCVAIVIGVYQYRHHPKKDHEPQKTVEEILQERARQAAGELTSPLGQAILAKNWPQTETLLKTIDRPHLHFANSIRALFIQNKINSYTVMDLDALENLVVDELEREPLRDELGYQLLATQLYRLPLLGPEYSSHKKLEETAKSAEGGPYHEQGRIVALGKLIMQGIPPTEHAIKQFENELGKIDPNQWTTIVDGTRHAPTQDRLIQHLIKNWKSLSPDTQVQALTLFSNALNVPKNRDTIVASLQSLKTPKNVPLVEASLRYLSALNEKGGLSGDQKKKIAAALGKIDNSEKSPFLSAKIDDLVKKMK